MSYSPHRSRSLKLAIALALGAAATQRAPAGTPSPGTLPVPCAPASCGAGGPSGFVTHGTATATSKGNALTINQTSNSATLNWASFNVGSGASVTFKQPGTSSVALNRIYQVDPSQIFGTVKANGQIYLINPNGFLFGNGSVVNVGSLLASSLNVSDATFASGVLNPALLLNGQAAFAQGLNADGTQGAVNPNASITVQRGATMSSNLASGRLMLAAPTVDNAGSLSAPDGQVILAAGQKVYLQASPNSDLRGLIVEVDGGGTATNEVGASLSAARGNVTMLGLAVNQLGRASATTSVTANGSIRLVAGDNIHVGIDTGGLLERNTGGTLTLGPQSRTTVTPDASSGTAVDGTLQQTSTLDFEGAQIYFKGGSQVVAPSGQLNVTARLDPNPQQGTPSSQTPDGASIRVDSGALIDVSGSSDSVPVATNVVEAQLRANEFADSPDQRNGPLRGQTVFIDVRQGTASRPGTSIANLSGEAGLIQRDIYQRTATGGNVSFDSSGDVAIQSGSRINVSGGVVNYTPGWIQTSYLVTADGRLVPISQASETTPYVGVVNPTVSRSDDRWGTITVSPGSALATYDPGYAQGYSAGSIRIQSPTVVLQGALEGTSVTGARQRAAGTTVPGGQLVIGSAPTAGTGTPDLRAPAIEITNDAAPITVADGTALPAGTPLQLSTTILNQDGFSRVGLYSNGGITEDAGANVTLPVGGSLLLNSSSIVLNATTTIPGGSISAVALPTTPAAGGASPATTGVTLGDGAVLDVRGNWTNDGVLLQGQVPTSPVALNGGSISLNQTIVGGTLSIGDHAALEVSAGAWQQQGGTLTPGTAGSIALNAGVGGTLTLGSGIALDGYGGQGASKNKGSDAPGGSFTLTAPRIEITSGGGNWAAAQTVSADRATGGILDLDASLFSKYGFASFTLNANAPALTQAADPATLFVAPHTQINLTPATYVFTPQARAAGSAADLSGILAPTLAPAFQHLAESLSLNNTLGSGVISSAADIAPLEVGAGSLINADPRSRVSLTSLGSIALDGTIRAPGGSVTAQIGQPADAIDAGYLPALAIDLGAGAVLDVSGTAIYQPVATGLLTGSLLAGGNINLGAVRGSVIAEQGSRIDIDGASAPFDITPPASAAAPVRTTLGSSAGSLTVSAPESISLIGTLQAEGGYAAGIKAPGGTLSVTLSRLSTGFNSGVTNPGSFPSGERAIELMPDAPAVVQPAASGLAVLDPKRIAASGVDNLTLSSDQIQIASGTSLTLGRALDLQTSSLVMTGGQATLSAPYLAVGAGTLPYVVPTSTPGSARLTLTGTESVDLIGSVAFSGVGSATISSGGFIQLRGNAQSPVPTGSLAIAGNLDLVATEVFPATQTAYTITASGSPGDTVTITQAGTRPGTPLSANGSLTINADDINQNGSLVAPFGTIALNAIAPMGVSATDGVLTLGTGSYTSVSGAGALIPYGQVNNGTAWVYGLTAAQANSLTPINVSVVPTRQVTLNGAHVSMTSGSHVNLAGGGDLYAYEFTPGTGGTTDALANSQSSGLYAILPSQRNQFASYDPLLYSDSGLAPGTSVYIAGGGGLAAGYYPLLPARYALLPGAYLVQAVSGYTNLTPGSTATTPNGATVVAGYRTFGETGLGTSASTYSGFELQPGSYARELASYTDNLASTFFPARAAATGQPAPVVPGDAGTLAILAQQSLSAAGSVTGTGASGGHNALIEISAPAIEIDAGSGATAAPTPGVAQLAASELMAWTPGRVLLGGLYTGADAISVTSTTVDVMPGAAITAGEIVAVASDSITVGAGATLQTTAAAAGKAVTVSPTPTVLALSGTDAGSATLLAVSDYAAYVPSRSGAANPGAGTLAIGAGAAIAARGGISLDVPGGATLAPGVFSGVGANFALGAGHVVFGSAASVPGALALDPSVVSAVTQGSALEVTTPGAIDFANAVNIGSTSATASLASITLDAATLNNLAGASSTLSARTITLGGPATAPAAPTGGTGTLTLRANALTLGPGFEAINGFAKTDFTVGGAITGSGTGGVIAGGDLAATSTVLTAASGAQTQIAATGALTLGRASGATPARGTLASGGEVALTGQTVTDATAIILPSGEVSITSAGATTLASGALIDVAGLGAPAAGLTHGSPGGRIQVSAGTDLTEAAGATLDVSGGTRAAGGLLSLNAGGTATLSGRHRGGTDAGQHGAAFALTAGSLASFRDLATGLSTGGFTAQQSVEVRTGNLDLAAGTTLTARSVSLIADSGSISIEGGINASGTGSRGSIVLDAGNGVSLAGTAVLSANGTDGTTRGGRIEISTTAGSVSLDPNASVSAHGAGAYGELIVRAPTVGGDVAIGSLPTALSGVDRVFIEPVQSFALSSGTPGAGEFAADEASVASWVNANGASVLSRLGVAAAGNVALSPYIDFTYGGDLTLPTLNLASWRFNGAPATVAFHATGNLTVAGTLSDGFTTTRINTGTRARPVFVTFTDLAAGPSSSLVLVAGADTTSASATGVVAGAAADLTVTDGSIVRTGTGDIALASARDVLIGSPGGRGASVYTGGIAGSATFNPALVPNNQKNLAFYTTYPDAGGNLSVSAGRDIVASSVVDAPSNWQPRSAALTAAGTVAPTWGVDPGKFGWSFGALGGGDVTLNAGRNAVDVSAAVADSATITNGALTYFGGGNLAVSTGQDVQSSEFYVGHGVGNVRAYGALGSDPAYGSNTVGTMLFAGNASYSVVAQGDVLLEGEAQTSALSAKLPTGALSVPNPLDPSNPTLSSISGYGYFYRYSPDSALAVASTGGSVTLRVNSSGLSAFLPDLVTTDPFTGVSLAVLAPNLDVASYGGSTAVSGNVYVYPSTGGNLSVYGAKDIDLTNAFITMLDTPGSLFHGVDNPGGNQTTAADVVGAGSASAALHTGDLAPAVIAAGRDLLGNSVGAALQLPKAAQITAGRNIVDLGFTLQNDNATDVSIVQAGGSISYSPAAANLSDVIGGGGRVDFLAGGDIDLGFSRGITTVGSLLNGNLSTGGGADLNVLVGLGQSLDVPQFLSTVVAPSPAYQGELVAFVEQQTGQSGLSYSAAQAAFEGLAPVAQRPLVFNIFFDALVQSGRQANAHPAIGFTKGFEAINALFPGSNPATGQTSPYAGSLGLGFSQIYTLDGGNISILAPGGSVDVGLANPPGNLADQGLNRPPSQLGIVAEGPGNVDIFTYGDVNVNSSRVFTLGGGSIAIWSSHGNIDAGRGAKTSVSAPPPTITVNSQGQVTVNFGAAVAGSGIRTIQTQPDQTPGNVDLDAPNGIVNAGDAGIGSAGNLNVAAVGVAGLDNIQVGGTSTGVPPAVSGIGAALSGASGAASASSAASTSAVASNSSAKDAAQAGLGATALGWLDVFVTGLGEDSCKPDDVECLRRQKH